MVEFLNGPAADVVLRLRRSPLYLRVVRARRGGWYANAAYAVAAEQPDDATVRTAAKWQAWCVAQQQIASVKGGA